MQKATASNYNAVIQFPKMAYLERDQSAKGKMSKGRGPNLNTILKIQELAAYREKYIRDHQRPPSWIPACRKIKIDHRTAKKHAPELIEKWKDENFRW